MRGAVLDVARARTSRLRTPIPGVRRSDPHRWDRPRPSIENEHISAVGNKSELAIPKNARVSDVSGKWIVPGLIDAHVHFFQSGGLYTRPDVIDSPRDPAV